jgi:hypothetical protein
MATWIGRRNFGARRVPACATVQTVLRAWGMLGSQRQGTVMPLAPRRQRTLAFVFGVILSQPVTATRFGARVTKAPPDNARQPPPKA